jgi:hypothetical protein
VQRRSESTPDSGHGVDTEEIVDMTHDTYYVDQVPVHTHSMPATGDGHGCQGAPFVGLRVERL